VAIDETRPRTRRAILAGAIGGLAGLVGSRIAWPDEASAAAGGHMLIGRSNSAGTKNTALTTTTNSGNALKVTQKGTGIALRGSASKGTAVSGATGSAAKFGVEAVNNGAAAGPGAAMRATGGKNAGLLATSDETAITATGTSNYGIYATGGYTGSRGQGGTYGSISAGSSVGAYGSGSDYGVYGAGGTYGVYGGGSTYGVYGSGPTGVNGSGSTYGVVGSTTNPNTDAVRGDGGQYGVHGLNGRTAGTRGDSGYVGAWGQATSYGVYGLATDSVGVSYGVFAQASNGASYAVWAQGNMRVTGTLTKAAGSFMIDHPLDPEGRWLSHSFVESPDMLNIYNGIAVLDASGKAAVELPDYFEALNTDFRYQLTAVGAPSPTLHVSSEIKKNAFRIAGGTPGQKVSWQVTGIRQDDYAKAHPIEVETDKRKEDRGTRQFAPKGSRAKLMKLGPAGAHDPQPATPRLVPDRVKPRDR
jgi:hypothetical protein